MLPYANFWGRYKDVSDKEFSDGLKSSRMDKTGVKMPQI